MHNINIPQAKQIVKHVAVNLDEPVFFHSQPGVGKTEAIYQVAEDEGYTVCDIRLSQYDTVDLKGFPDPNKESRQTEWFPASTLPFVGNNNFPDDRPIVLFFDEANSGTPPVLAIMYQLVNERRCGEFLLKPNVRIVAAGNRDGDRGVTTRLPTPLANRFTHYEVGLDVDAWCEWAQGAGIAPVGIAFMQFRKPLLSTFDPAKTDKAFATPRTWQKSLTYYAATMPEDIKQASMAGAVGDGPAAEFWGFVDVWSKMIPMSQIEKDPNGTALPDEAAMTYAISVAISGTMTPKNCAPFHTYLMRLEPEFAVIAWRMALKRDPQMASTNEFIAFSKAYKAIWS